MHELLADIKEYMVEELDLVVKENHQVFPVAKRGIDFVGYVFYHTHILLRKTIKKSFARMLAKNNNPLSISSYKGWTKYCNSFNLLKKLLLKSFKDLKIDRTKQEPSSRLVGEKININKILNKTIVVHDFEIKDSLHYANTKCLYLQIEVGSTKRVVFTSAKKMIMDIQQIAQEDFPFETTIEELETNHFVFS